MGTIVVTTDKTGVCFSIMHLHLCQFHMGNIRVPRDMELKNHMCNIHRGSICITLGNGRLPPASGILCPIGNITMTRDMELKNHMSNRHRGTNTGVFLQRTTCLPGADMAVTVLWANTVC